MLLLFYLFGRFEFVVAHEELVQVKILRYNRQQLIPFVVEHLVNLLSFSFQLFQLLQRLILLLVLGLLVEEHASKVLLGLHVVVLEVTIYFVVDDALAAQSI